MTSEASVSEEKLLSAGVQHLLEDGIDIVVRGVNVDEVVRRSGVSQKTFYKTFGQKTQFVESMLSSLTVAPLRVTRELGEKVREQLVESGGDPRDTIRAVCAWDFEQVRADPSTILQLAIIVLGRDHDGAMKKLQQAYASYDEAGKSAYEAILARWGASMRSPFTPEKLAVVLSALVEGLVVRHLADPDAVSGELFGDAVLALVGSIVDTGQGHERIDDVIAPLARDVKVMYEAGQVDALPDNPRELVLDAARSEFGTRGYFSTTLTHISMAAKLPLRALKRLFPSKALIVVEALRPHVERLRQDTADDRTLGYSTAETVTRFLRRLATITTNDREYIDALLAIVAHETAAAPDVAVRVKADVDIPAILVPALRAGQESGELARLMSAEDAAAMVVNSLFLRCFTRRNETIDQQVSAVMAMLFQGLLARPADAPSSAL
ncbi:TetR/AcrR family transcriptional regulator [Amycolatopsis sp. NPDC098790]|uniref:TetR/AcrR family transcriptional regulator n=1 Tax=Amycolatopsis sp. NPDC098790 TaxID=3363939 RepID=UPI003815EC19